MSSPAAPIRLRDALRRPGVALGAIGLLVAPGAVGTARAQAGSGEAINPPTESYVVDLPVAPPIPEGQVAGNAIATFPVAQHPGAGVVRIGSFISAARVGPVPLPTYPIPFLVWGEGNDRTFDPNFDANRTKLTIELNFETGEGTAWATPSCILEVEVAGLVFPAEQCLAALPLDGTATGSQILTGTEYTPSGSSGTFISYIAQNSVVDVAPGLRELPSINGEIGVLVSPVGDACLIGKVDTYPSVEAYQYHPDGRVRTLLQTPESGFGPPVLANSPGKAIDTCGY